MALMETGKVCIYRPRRKNPRVFTPNDVARIAKYAAHNAEPKEILFAVIVALGLAATFCRVAIALRNLLALNRMIMQLAFVLGVSDLLKRIITALETWRAVKVATFVIKPLKFAAWAVISILAFINSSLNYARSIFDDYRVAKEFVEFIGGSCQTAYDAAVQAGEDASEFISDLNIPDLDDINVPDLDDIGDYLDNLLDR